MSNLIPFVVSEEPTLPVATYRYCPYGAHTLPETTEYFSYSHQGQKFRWAAYCRPCMNAYGKKRKQERRDSSRRSCTQDHKKKTPMLNTREI